MKRCGEQRGVVLFAVLVVIALASLVGTTVLIIADADRAGAEVTLRRTRARALAWSGVQAVMAELAWQRETLLDGGRARVTDEWSFSGDEGPGRGVVRLVPLGGDGPLASESARLDVNRATAEMLAGLPGVGDELAGRIIAARARGPLESVEELLGVEGLDDELLHGRRGGDSASGVARGGGADASPLGALVTVFSADPNVQSGLGPSGEGHRGERRFNINSSWNERLGRAVAGRFGQEFADGLKGLMQSGRRFERDSDIARALVEFGVPPEEWTEVFDAFCTTPDEYVYGRVDLNSAPVEVLARIPGLDESAAARIVGARRRLDADALRSVAWPAAEGLVPPESFAEAVDWLTTRSMQWRVRVEAGFEAADAAGDRPGEGAPALLRDRVVLEAVIDVASERPRVAYLRDVTLLDEAREAWARMERADSEGPGGVEGGRERAGPASEAPASRAGAPSRLGRVPSRQEEAERARRARVRETPSMASPALPAEGDAPGGESQTAGPDRRIGRWNPAGGGRP